MSYATHKGFRIIGLDLSLTSAGIAYANGETHVLHTPASRMRGMERLAYIRDEVSHVVLYQTNANPTDLVVIEGYSYGSKGRGTISLGELGGAIRLMLFDLKIPFIEVAPSSLKKFATLNGRAQKEHMLVAARNLELYWGSNDNEADAAWLRAFGHYVKGSYLVPQSPERDEIVRSALGLPEGEDE